MTTPTPGRVLHFFPSINDGIARNGDHPLAALIVAVLGDRLVNLAVFDANGTSHARTDVQLIQDDTDVYVTDDARAEWPVQAALQKVAADAVVLGQGLNGPYVISKDAPLQGFVGAPVTDPADAFKALIEAETAVTADEKTEVAAIADAPVEANETPAPVEPAADAPAEEQLP